MGEQSWRLVNNELMVRVSYMNVHQILHIFATFTHLYSFPTRSKCVGEALLVGWSCCLVAGSSISAVYMVGWVTLTFKKRAHLIAITTDLFAFPMVLSAISGSGRSKMWGRFGWLELLSCWQQQWCHLETLLPCKWLRWRREPVMARRMMAAPAVETQSMMGRGENERMRAV